MSLKALGLEWFRVLVLEEIDLSESQVCHLLALGKNYLTPLSEPASSFVKPG